MPIPLNHSSSDRRLIVIVWRSQT